MHHRQRFFIVGPPGVGKSSIMVQVCARLDLSLLDLSLERFDESERLQDAWQDALAGERQVVVMHWRLAQDAGARRAARKAGMLIALWDHPLNMIERAREPLTYHPSREMKTRGGFGSTGKATREYRALKRTSDDALDLVDADVDEAVDFVVEVLEYYIDQQDASPVERAGIQGWNNEWIGSYGADPRAAEKLQRALADFLVDLEENGTSDRQLRQVRSDLQAAAQLTFNYDLPGPDKILVYFRSAPSPYDFRRKYTDSPNLIARYARNCEKFARFLERRGDI